MTRQSVAAGLNALANSATPAQLKRLRAAKAGAAVATLFTAFCFVVSTGGEGGAAFLFSLVLAVGTCAAVMQWLTFTAAVATAKEHRVIRRRDVLVRPWMLINLML